MPRDITVTLQDGSQHIYKNAPDDITPDAATARAQKDFGMPVTHLDGGRPPPSGNTAPSWGDAALQAPFSALGQLGDAAVGAGKFIASLPEDPLGYKIGRALKAAPGAIADELGGMTQYVRNLSKPEFRGSAPTYPGGEPENHPYLALTQGDTAPLRQELANKPLNIVGDAAALTGAVAPRALGAVSDFALAGPRKLGRAIVDMTPQNRAENDLLQASQRTSNPQAIAQALEQNRSQVPGVSYSVAQASQDPGMAQLEKGSRSNPALSPAWTQFDTGQNSGLYGALHGIVNPATDEAVRAAQDARTAATQYDRRAALSLADQGSFEPHAGFDAGDVLAPKGLQPRDTPNQFAGPIRDAAAYELIGDRGVLPGVEKTANFVLDKVPGEDASAGRTYEVRKMLADALNARQGQQLDEIASAAKSGGVSTRNIKNAIDSSLDQASGGMWHQYLDAFASNSKDVNSVQALNNIRADLLSKMDTGAVDLRGNPKLTRAWIANTVESNATNKYGDLIAPAIKKKLDAITETAQNIEAPLANYRLGATGGGGPDTAATIGLMAGHHLASALGPVGRVAAAVLPGLGEAGGATRLAELLQNPVDAAQALRTAAARDAARKMKSNGTKPALLAAALAAQQQ